MPVGETVKRQGIRALIFEKINPTAAPDDVGGFFTLTDLTIIQMNGVCNGLTDATWTIRFDVARSLPGIEVITGGTTSTGGVGTTDTSFDEAVILAGTWVWMEVTAKTGSPAAVIVTVTFA